MPAGELTTPPEPLPALATVTVLVPASLTAVCANRTKTASARSFVTNRKSGTDPVGIAKRLIESRNRCIWTS